MFAYAMGFIGGAAAMYAGTGFYFYTIGKPMNGWLRGDAKVNAMAILTWPVKVRQVMRAGVIEG